MRTSSSRAFGTHQLRGNEVLGVLDRLNVRLALAAEAKVEGVTPAVLVEVGGQVVERLGDVGVIRVVLLIFSHVGKAMKWICQRPTT